MPSSYLNDLRIELQADGENASTWGQKLNDALTQIGDALAYGTQDCFATDANATTTVADGAADPARAMYFKVTSTATLTATRTLTIAPNTISRVMFIENATTGSQSITISQGSGSTVTIATGKTAVVYLDGAGATAAVVDAMAKVDPGVTDTLAEVLVAGNTSGGTGLTMSSGDDLTLTGASYNAVWDSSANSLAFADNAKATFGAGDLQIFHDGSNSYIDDTGTGNLFVRASDNFYVQNAAGTETKAAFTTDGAVKLYYNGGTKFQTVSGGIDVIGTVTADGLTIGDFSGNSVAQISAGTTGVSSLYLGDGSSGAASYAGFVEYNHTGDYLRLGANSAEVVRVSSTGIDVTGSTVTDGLTSAVTDGASFAGNFNHTGGTVGRNGIKITSSGTSGTTTLIEAIRNTTNTVFKVDGSGNLILNDQSGNQNFNFNVTGAATFNEQGADADFRVESDTNTHALFVDASANAIGFGTTSSLVSDASNEGLYYLIGGSLTLASNTESLQINRNGTGANNRVNIGLYNNGTKRGEIGTYGAEDGMYFYTGSTVDSLRLTSGETAFNEGGADINFRVESDGASHMLFVDAGNNRLGINTSSPGTLVHIENAASDNLKYGSNPRLELTVPTGVNGLRIKSDTTPLELQHLTDGSSMSVGSNYTTTWNAPNATSGAQNKNSPSLALSPKYWNGTASAIGWQGFIQAIQSSATSTDGYLGIGAGAATDLKFKADGSETIFNDGGDDTDFRVESDGASHMLFVDAGNNRVGIGTSAPETPLEVSTSLAGTAVLIESSNAGASDGPTLNLWRNSASPVNGDGLGSLVFQGENSTGGRTSFAQIRVEASDVTAAGENGLMSIRTTINGTDSARINLKSSEAVINESGGDIDFRVESNSNSHMLFVDAGNNRVGINQSSPSYDLDVNGTLQITGTIRRAGSVIFSSTGSLTEIGPGGNGSVSFHKSANMTTGDEMAIFGASEAVFNERSFDQDFRVESDNNANMLFVDAGGDFVGIGSTTSDSLSSLSVKTKSGGNAKELLSTTLISGSGEAASMVEGCVSVNTVSSGNQLTIPITSQGSKWERYIIDMTFVSGEYNESSNATGGTVKVRLGSLTSLSTVTELDKTGNVASISSSGMNLLINFTSAFTAGLSNYEGVLVYYKIVGTRPRYIEFWNATLN